MSKSRINQVLSSRNRKWSKNSTIFKSKKKRSSFSSRKLNTTMNDFQNINNDLTSLSSSDSGDVDNVSMDLNRVDVQLLCPLIYSTSIRLLSKTSSATTRIVKCCKRTSHLCIKSLLRGGVLPLWLKHPSVEKINDPASFLNHMT